MKSDFYHEISANRFKSGVIMVFFIAFVAVVGYVFGLANGYGPSWGLMAFFLSLLVAVFSFFWGDQIVLSLSGARLADKKRDFNFYTVAENLCLGSGLPQPKLYVLEDSAPNAFATGRDPKHASICATTGLLTKLNRTELEGVISHELSHVQNYDSRLMVITSVLVGTVALLSDWFTRSLWFDRHDRDEDNKSNLGIIIFILAIVLSLLAPIIAQLIQLAISRRREFLADASAVALTRYPKGLIAALEKISADYEPLEAANRATAHLYFVNPFKGKKITGMFLNLFNTHPPIEERINALRTIS